MILLVALSSCLLRFLITVVLYNFKSVKFKAVSGHVAALNYRQTEMSFLSVHFTYFHLLILTVLSLLCLISRLLQSKLSANELFLSPFQRFAL